MHSYNIYIKIIMKFFTLAVFALIGASAVSLDQKSVVAVNEPCEPALDVSEK